MGAATSTCIASSSTWSIRWMRRTIPSVNPSCATTVVTTTLEGVRQLNYYALREDRFQLLSCGMPMERPR